MDDGIPGPGSRTLRCAASIGYQDVAGGAIKRGTICKRSRFRMHNRGFLHPHQFPACLRQTGLPSVEGYRWSQTGLIRLMNKIHWRLGPLLLLLLSGCGQSGRLYLPHEAAPHVQRPEPIAQPAPAVAPASSVAPPTSVMPSTIPAAASTSRGPAVPSSASGPDQ